MKPRAAGGAEALSLASTGPVRPDGPPGSARSGSVSLILHRVVFESMPTSYGESNLHEGIVPFDSGWKVLTGRKRLAVNVAGSWGFR